MAGEWHALVLSQRFKGAAERDDQENVERGETGHGARTTADERKPVDGASGIRRGKRPRRTGYFPAGRSPKSQPDSVRGARRTSGGAVGHTSGARGPYGRTPR